MTARTVASPEDYPMLKRYSDLHRLLRVTAWCRRCLPRTRDRNANRQRYTLTASESNEAERMWIRKTQATHFNKELKLISDRTTLPKTNALTCLNPFVDPDSILRVGRLKHSHFSMDEKHPIILPPLSDFTRLIVESCHRRFLHGSTADIGHGASTVLDSTRQTRYEAVHPTLRHLSAMAGGSGRAAHGQPSSGTRHSNTSFSDHGHLLRGARLPEVIAEKRSSSHENLPGHLRMLEY